MRGKGSGTGDRAAHADAVCRERGWWVRRRTYGGFGAESCAADDLGVVEDLNRLSYYEQTRSDGGRPPRLRPPDHQDDVAHAIRGNLTRTHEDDDIRSRD